MFLLDLTLPTPAENLACDEVLLDLADEDAIESALRFWLPAQAFVVVGYANRVQREVNVDFCTRAGIPILRRCSGGGTVLQARGCLNYSVVLRIAATPELAGIHSTNTFVLSKVANALAKVLGRNVQLRGQTDLALGDLKIAGNAQRRKKSALLFHGCVLLNIDVDLVEHALLPPSRQPDYRADRSHRQFITNLGVSPEPIKTALAAQWDATPRSYSVPFERIRHLARDKYESYDWTHRF